MRVRLFIIAVLSILCSDLHAQFPAPVKDSIYSAVFGEHRDIVIANMRQAIILPIRKGNYALRVECPAYRTGQVSP